MDSMETIEEAGITQMEAVQYFHAADRIRDTVVGIAASMVLNREGASKDLPIIAFAQAEDGIKVSARTTRELVARGLDLAAVMQTASLAVGGQGGGHHGAAGATIPPGTEEKFLEVANRLVREQLGGRQHPSFAVQRGSFRIERSDVIPPSRWIEMTHENAVSMAALAQDDERGQTDPALRNLPGLQRSVRRGEATELAVRRHDY